MKQNIVIFPVAGSDSSKDHQTNRGQRRWMGGGNKERVVAATRGSVDQMTPLWEIAPRHEHSRANQNPQIVTK